MFRLTNSHARPTVLPSYELQHHSNHMQHCEYFEYSCQLFKKCLAADRPTIEIIERRIPLRESVPPRVGLPQDVIVTSAQMRSSPMTIAVRDFAGNSHCHPPSSR